jgi:hypothetical protein
MDLLLVRMVERVGGAAALLFPVRGLCAGHSANRGYILQLSFVVAKHKEWFSPLAEKLPQRSYQRTSCLLP